MRTTIAALTVILGLGGLTACRSEVPVAAPSSPTTTTASVQRPIDTVSTPPTTTTTVPPVAVPVPTPKPPVVPKPVPPKPVPTTKVAPKPQYIVVNKGDKVPNISPPTKLYIKGVTAAECDNMGGWFDDAIATCKNVDY
jgi:outer membrane biosynthesis protein TonB